MKVRSFNEFVVKLNKPVKEINQKLLAKVILLVAMTWVVIIQNLQNHMLIAVTELRTKEEIDTFVTELGDYHA